MVPRALGGLLLVSLLLAPAAAADGPAPVVDLIIAAPGHNTGSAWYGHAGLLVHDGAGTRYYHYELDLQEGLLRPTETALGHARFHLAAWDKATMLDFYGGQGREVRSLRLHLDPDAARALVADLDAELAAGPWWPYDMIRDNCATRLRDRLDDATGGALHAATGRTGASLRDRALPYFAHAPGITFASFLAVGQAADVPMTDWEALLFPLDLQAAMQALTVDGQPVADDPVVLREATRALEPVQHGLGWTSAGTGLLFGSALALLGGRSGQDRRRAVAWSAIAVGTLVGLGSLLLMLLSSGSTDPLWTDNLDLLLLPPFAFALPLAGWRALRGHDEAWTALHWSAALLVACTAMVWLLEATGAVVQDSGLFIAAFAPVYLGLLVAVDRNARTPTPG